MLSFFILFYLKINYIVSIENTNFKLSILLNVKMFHNI